MKPAMLLAGLLLALLPPAGAGAADASKLRHDTSTPSPAEQCDEALSQLELNQCAAATLARADAELNATWGEIMASLDARPVAKQSLIAAQRRWIALRDADMAALYPLEAGEDLRVQYGTIQPMQAAFEQAAMTRERRAWLRRNFLAADGH